MVLMKQSIWEKYKNIHWMLERERSHWERYMNTLNYTYDV